MNVERQAGGVVLVCLRTDSSRGGQMLCIHTRTGCAVTLYVLCMKCTKHETQEQEADLITRGCLKVLEPREPGRKLYIGIMSDLF
jgi:hypothetical protein